MRKKYLLWKSQEMAEFETVEVTTDLLIVGGGMAACGAAIEAAYWAKKHNLKVVLVDKAAVERSGAKSKQRLTETIH